MKTPILIVNFKTYQSGTGEKALELARAADRVAKETGASIAVAVQAADIRIAREVSVPVLAQHVDPVGFGSHTGRMLPESVKESGAAGTLVNHSERRIGLEEVERSVKRCREAGLVAVVCAESTEEARKILAFKPDFIALEDPELIGTLQSVSKLKPDNVRAFSSLLEGTGVRPLCGAGVASPEDVRAALELGTEGVLVAAAVMKAGEPGRALEGLVAGLR
ncbi:MAG: triose-phosphate isomerase [Candidatus Aenigmatarchaeota archaeon]